MLWLLEFTREGHRYRAELRPDVGAPDASKGMAEGVWFVSMDGNPPDRAFGADVRDEDTEEFRRRVVSAARSEGGELRHESRESPQDEATHDEPDDEIETHPPHQP